MTETDRLASTLKALGAYPWSEEETEKFANGTTFRAVYDLGEYDDEGFWTEKAGEWDQFMVTEQGWISTSGNVYDYYSVIPKTITSVTPPLGESK